MPSQTPPEIRCWFCDGPTAVTRATDLSSLWECAGSCPPFVVRWPYQWTLIGMDLHDPATKARVLANLTANFSRDGVALMVTQEAWQELKRG